MLAVFVIALAFVLGGLVHTVAGFGLALVAMPIMTQVIGVRTATPVEAVLGLVIVGVVMYQNRSGLRWRESGRLIGGAILGIPVGTEALKNLEPSLITGCLGIALVGYWLFERWSARRGPAGTVQEEQADVPMKEERALLGAWVAGFFSGLLGGAYAASGPPLVIYAAIKGWDKQQFRSVLQSCFLVNGIVVVVWQGYRGLITAEVGWSCVYGFPGLVAGMLVGWRLDRYVNHERFRTLVLGLILVLGVFLLVRSLVV